MTTPIKDKTRVVISVGCTHREGLAFSGGLTMAGVSKKADPPTKRTKPDTDQPSEEYENFDRLTKRLLQVPKDEIKRQEKPQKRTKAR